MAHIIQNCPTLHPTSQRFWRSAHSTSVCSRIPDSSRIRRYGSAFALARMYTLVLVSPLKKAAPRRSSEGPPSCKLFMGELAPERARIGRRGHKLHCSVPSDMLDMPPPISVHQTSNHPPGPVTGAATSVMCVYPAPVSVRAGTVVSATKPAVAAARMPNAHRRLRGVRLCDPGLLMAMTVSSSELRWGYLPSSDWR